MNMETIRQLVTLCLMLSGFLFSTGNGGLFGPPVGGQNNTECQEHMQNIICDAKCVVKVEFREKKKDEIDQQPVYILDVIHVFKGDETKKQIFVKAKMNANLKKGQRFIYADSTEIDINCPNDTTVKGYEYNKCEDFFRPCPKDGPNEAAIHKMIKWIINEPKKKKCKILSQGEMPGAKDVCRYPEAKFECYNEYGICKKMGCHADCKWEFDNKDGC